MPRATALAIVVLLVSIAVPVQAHHIRDSERRFKTVCKYSHSLHDDPIVNPNQPGGAHHLHDFFGNRTTNAYSTTFASLQTGGTTCTDAADKAAYWAPAVYAGGKRVIPQGASEYYSANFKHGYISVIPSGLNMIAEGPLHTSWKCSGEGGGAQATPPRTCPNNDLVMSGEFPDCWDGKNLDSANHRTHVAYSSSNGIANVCPSTHPVQMAQLTSHNHVITSLRPITLSSGGLETLHFDFKNGWEAARYAFLNDKCINGTTRCSA